MISHLHVECKNKKIKQKENRLTENKHVVAKEEGAEMRVGSSAWGQIGEGDQEVQTSN